MPSHEEARGGRRLTPMHSPHTQSRQPSVQMGRSNRQNDAHSSSILCEVSTKEAGPQAAPTSAGCTASATCPTTRSRPGPADTGHRTTVQSALRKTRELGLRQKLAAAEARIREIEADKDNAFKPFTSWKSDKIKGTPTLDNMRERMLHFCAR